MKITTVIASGLIASTLWAPALQAQSLKSAGPPAEFPPASYKGSQYVDSRGCMYIRAGIDGVVDWVPRLSRDRKQICGQTPTRVAGATAGKPVPQAEMITLPQSQQPASQPVAAAKTPAPAKTQPAAAPVAAAVVAEPKTNRITPAAVPAATVAAPPAKAAPVEPACEGVSALSAQYMNKGARCGPQDSSPTHYVPPQSQLQLTPNTRVMPAHVYQQRRLSRHLEVPAGYRRVWEDDRLNGQRTVRTLKPAVITSVVAAPQGYIYVQRNDDRHNPARGLRTAGGDQQMAMVWTNTVPRRLIEQPIDRQVVTASLAAARSPAEAKASFMRLSTRSAPDAEAPQNQRRRYVRAATFTDAAQARAEAKRLAAMGLPVRLGNLTRAGKEYKVVLAGPFTGAAKAEKALVKVRDAGYGGARLSQ